MVTAILLPAVLFITTVIRSLGGICSITCILNVATETYIYSIAVCDDACWLVCSSPSELQQSWNN